MEAASPDRLDGPHMRRFVAQALTLPCPTHRARHPGQPCGVSERDTADEVWAVCGARTAIGTHGACIDYAYARPADLFSLIAGSGENG